MTYTKGEQNCGCEAVEPFRKGAEYRIVYCPLHKAAPAMLEALRLIVNPFSPLGLIQKLILAEKAIALAEGKDAD